MTVGQTYVNTALLKTLPKRLNIHKSITIRKMLKNETDSKIKSSHIVNSINTYLYR